MSTWSACLGILLMILTGLVVSGDFVTNRVMTKLGWPYWYITSVACFLSSGLLAVGLILARQPLITLSQLKWVVGRGSFGGAYWSLGVVAVQVGASPGDVAALMSISIVVAAFLGRLLLGEHLRLAHAGAVVFSVAGSLLIARPGFLFDVGQHESPWFGHLCAAASGFTQSCSFICSRKAADVSTGIHTFSSLFGSGLACFLLAVSGIVQYQDFEVVQKSPLEASGWLAVVLAACASGIFFASAGAVLCPVAVSATVYNASTMAFGYLAQTLILGGAPNTLSYAGAGLMLAAVVLMAVAQASARKEHATPAGATIPAAAPDTKDAAEVKAGDQKELERTASWASTVSDIRV